MTMKIIKLTATNIVLYAGDDVSLTAGHAITQSGSIDPSTTTANAVMETGAILPDGWTGGAWTYAAGVWTLVNPPVVPPVDRQAMGVQIDDAVADTMSPYTRFTEEYTLRESQAQAYKDAGYTGAVPDQVAAFATPAGMQPQAATDLILSQAASLRGALDTLGKLRMQKYAVFNAANDATATATFNAIMANIKSVADALS